MDGLGENSIGKLSQGCAILSYVLLGILVLGLCQIPHNRKHQEIINITETDPCAVSYKIAESPLPCAEPAFVNTTSTRYDSKSVISCFLADRALQRPRQGHHKKRPNQLGCLSLDLDLYLAPRFNASSAVQTTDMTSIDTNAQHFFL